MPRTQYTKSDISLIARMMRAEAVGEGSMGMLMVGNVIVNRVKADCLDFKGLTTIQEVIFQVQGNNFAFEAVQKGNLFYQRARTKEKRLAKQVLDFWVHSPSKWALWYFNPHAACPDSWYGQPFSGQYKNHCYYLPKECPGAYRW